MDKNDPSGAEYWRRRALGLPEPKEYKAYPITKEQMVKEALDALNAAILKSRKRAAGPAGDPR